MIKRITGLFGVNSLKDRSKVVAKNAIASLFLKGLGILVSFAFVPLYLGAVGQRKFGIILTITSISSFVSFFDVGIGKGLRIKLAQAIADGRRLEARQYVSTSYFYVTIMFATFFVLYCLVSSFLNWHKLLNIPANEIPELDSLIFIIVGLFVASFVLQLVGTILLADQKSSMNDSMGFFNNLTLLIVCFVLRQFDYLNFYSLILTMLGLPVFMQIIYSIVLFTTKYKWLRPSFKFVNHAMRRDLLSLGVKYFIIQIVALTIFSTTNILIAQLFDIGEVTRYNIGFKYYNVTVMVFTILMSPLWGAFTHAWHQGDVKWISKNIKFYLGIVVVFVFANLAQVFIYPYFVHIWLKRELVIPAVLASSFILYNFIFCYNEIFAHFLAGIGNINKQIYAAVAGGILNIPITIYLARHTELGLSSILFANVICLLPSTIVTTIQTINILNERKQQLVKA